MSNMASLRAWQEEVCVKDGLPESLEGGKVCPVCLPVPCGRCTWGVCMLPLYTACRYTRGVHAGILG